MSTSPNQLRWDPLPLPTAPTDTSDLPALKLTGDPTAGKAVFTSMNCASCHGGTGFTNSGANTLSNIGTIKASSGQRLGTALPGIDVPTLRDVWATAPYLHNGSVPTLRALLEPARRRPVTFPLGHTGFVFDTRLPGNRNIGHEYGTALTPSEKDDLVAFLETL